MLPIGVCYFFLWFVPHWPQEAKFVYYMLLYFILQALSTVSVCVYVCVCACVRACVRVCVCVLTPHHNLLLLGLYHSLVSQEPWSANSMDGWCVCMRVCMCVSANALPSPAAVLPRPLHGTDHASHQLQQTEGLGHPIQ